MKSETDTKWVSCKILFALMTEIKTALVLEDQLYLHQYDFSQKDVIIHKT